MCLQLLKLPRTGTVKVLGPKDRRVAHQNRISLENDKLLEATAEYLERTSPVETTTQALLKTVRRRVRAFPKVQKKRPPKKRCLQLTERPSPARPGRSGRPASRDRVEQKQDLLRPCSVSGGLRKSMV